MKGKEWKGSEVVLKLENRVGKALDKDPSCRYSGSLDQARARHLPRPRK
jgi:hypothetical protein